ncbi:hypothetical protein FB554_0927 [Barrientosiimonas humi]|uniref:Uncharacterized protein n=2 Tax=Barrientosiimonas TaxID=1535207 RepID=A0A542XAC5_9MICO|nr:MULTISPECIES: hypothetical protein [Barrientosiimonas]TQL32795.1 hypothetical protein FB554_0927 [Barrientosiimonas humi]BDZ57617.1 hypothetical protein GCM10025872_12740 [Barrientosiimonas endolithica]CAG7572786.1 hypothetical protein BH39T_PBIAJDOK_01409 [Barrientosiimonas humi]
MPAPLITPRATTTDPAPVAAPPPSPGAPSRRTLAKGAAWAVPAVALGAMAPVMAASAPPQCPTCLVAGAGGAFTAQGAAALGLASVSGTAVFNIDSTACRLDLFEPAYAVLGVGGTVSWSDGRTTSLTVATLVGAGTFGRISAVNATFTTVSRPIPNGTPPALRPTRVCFDFTAIFVALIPPGLELECPYTICYDVTNVTTTGAVALGSGTVNWTGTLGRGSLTTRTTP